MTIKTVPAIVVRVGASFRTPPGLFCSNTENFSWFPIQQGVTSLPLAPVRTLNPNPLPANAAEIPADWDDSDMCRLFQDILPRYIDPVYKVELFSTQTIKPYSEAYPLTATVRIKIIAESFPYVLAQSRAPITATVFTRISELARYPLEVLLKINSRIEVLAEFEGALGVRLVIKIKINTSGAAINAPAIALLHMDGLEGSTNFIDEIGNSWTSQYAKITYAQSKIGASVGDFTTPTSSLSCTDESLEIGTFSFTIDFWFYPISITTGSSTGWLFSAGKNGTMSEDYGIFATTGSNLYYRYTTGSGSSNDLFLGNVSNFYNNWHHVLISRNNYNFSAYIDGVLKTQSFAASDSNFGTSSLMISKSSTNKYVAGYIDEFRYIKGVGLNYPSPFTPQSTPYDPQPAIKGVRLIIKVKIIASFAYINLVSQATLRIKTDAFYTTGYNFKPIGYAGNSSSRTISDLGFRPSFVWTKAFGSDFYGVSIFDTLRGPLKGGSFSGNFGENTHSNTLTSFSSYGFTLGNSSTLNGAGINYCAWAFGGNQSTRSFGKQTVSDGYIAESTYAMVESDAISYGYYSSNGTNGLNLGQGSYVYHGFTSEPEVVLCTGVTANVACRMVGELVGYNTSVPVASSDSATPSSSLNPIYYYNPSRPGYVRLGHVLDSGTDNRYVYHAFKSKPGKVYAGTHAGSSSVDTRINTGFEPAIIIAKMLYTAAGSASPAYCFDAVRGWDTAIPWSAYTATISTNSLEVDSSGFTVKKNSTLSADRTLWIYIAIAGTLVSPLGGLGKIIDIPLATIQATGQLPSVDIQFNGILLDIPTANIALRAGYMPLIAKGTNITIEGKNASFFVTVPVPAEPGGFTWNGQDALLFASRRLSASTGTHVISSVGAVVYVEDYFSNWASQTYSLESLIYPDWWTD